MKVYIINFMLLLFVLFSQSYLHNWRQLNSSVFDRIAIYSPKGVFTSTAKPGARLDGCVLKQGRSLYVWGGVGYSAVGTMGQLGDLWEYNTEIKQWRFLSGFQTVNEVGQSRYYYFHPNCIPRPKTRHSCWLEDTNSILSHGGINDFENVIRKDMWEFNITLGQWRCIMENTGAPLLYNSSWDWQNTPYLAQHTSVRLNSESILIFGGRFLVQTEPFNILFEWNHNPSSPNYHLMRYITGGPKIQGIDQATFMGMLTGGNYPNETLRGIRVDPDVYFPPERFGVMGWAFQNMLYLFGGGKFTATDKVFYNDLWIWDHPNRKWIWAAGSQLENQLGVVMDPTGYHKDNIPRSRYHGSVTKGMSDDLTVIIGGETYDGYMSDIFVFSARRNMFKLLNSSLIVDYPRNSENLGIVGARVQHAVSTDSKTGLMYLFSGKGVFENGAIFPLQDLYVFEGGIIQDCNGNGYVDYTSPDKFTYQPGVESCVCYENYTGINCEFWECYGVSFLDPNVCFNHGYCRKRDDCECDNEYFGTNCSAWYCNGTTNTDINVCNGHGSCDLSETCVCTDEYLGDYCEGWACNWCHSHGVCDVDNNCVCFEGYEASSNCSRYKCFEYYMDDLDNVCNYPIGECTGYNLCNCSQDYYGSECKEKIWGGILYGEFRKIYVNYTMPLSFAQAFGESFDCSLIIDNYMELGANSVCEWEYSFKTTNMIIVNLGPGCNFATLDTLNIKTITKESEVISFPLTYIPGPNRSFIDQLLDILADIWIGLVIFGSIILIIILIILIITIIVSINNYRMERKKMKYSRIKNLDIIIQEQNADKDKTIPQLIVNKELLAIKYDQVKIVEKIGKGGSSVVYKAEWKGQIVAFKVFSTSCSTTMNFDLFEKEIAILSSIRNPFILKFFGATLKGSRLGIVFEYCELGDLELFIKENPKRLPFSKKIELLTQMAMAMEYLHDREIMHRDFKCKNVLLTEGENKQPNRVNIRNIQARVIDFGLSRTAISKTGSHKLTRRVGTQRYMAPEVVVGNKYDQKCDVFSYAIVFYEVMTENFNPYDGMEKDFNVGLKVARDSTFRPKFDENKYVKWKWVVDRIMKVCWKDDPEKRLPFSEIVKILKE